MLTRSVTRLPGVCLRFRYSLLLPLLMIVLAPYFWAQGPDDDDDDDGSSGSFASLTLRYDARGNAEVRFFAYGEVQNWNGIKTQLEQTLHCPVGSLLNPPSDSRLPKYIASRPAKEQDRYRHYAEMTRRATLQGSCPAAMARTRLLLSTDLHLQALVEELKLGGVKRLSMTLSYPKAKFSEHTPGVKLPWEAGLAYSPERSSIDPIVRTNYSLDTTAPSPLQIHLAFGLRNRDVVRAAMLPAVFLIAPVLICLWMSTAAVRDAKADPTGAWFSYYRVLAWCGNGLVLIWMMGHTVRQGLETIASYYTAAHTAGAVALDVGILMLPPWLTFFICILLSYRVYRHVRAETWTRGEFFANQLLGVAVQFLPLAFLLAGIGMIAVNGQASVALFGGVYASYVGCKWLQARYSGLHFEPLTHGELRDKVFEIAKKAAVEIRQVFIVPAGKSQMANAFASRDRMVMFTDYLLSRMNKREVSAIAAHEIAHIQRKHPTWNLAAFVALMFSSEIMFGILSGIVNSLRHALEARQVAEGASAATGLATIVHVGDQVLAFPELILVLFALALFLYHRYSQHMEYVADAGAVQFTGDPEAMITSLLKLSHLNQTPVQWDRATGSLLTHPSTLKRVQHIARVGQVPSERLQQLLRESATPQSETEIDASWELSEQQFKVVSPNTVVTLRSFSGELTFKKWILRAVTIAPAATIAWAVSHYNLPHKAISFSLGGALCVGLYVAMGEWQTTWFRKRLKCRFIERLTTEGITAPGEDVRIIALSPHASPRAYAMGFSWDTGVLFFNNDRLCYVGDQTRFALTREQVLSVRLDRGVPDWLGETRIYFDWQESPDKAVQTWNILPKDPHAVWRSNRQCRAFATLLERWRSRLEPYPEVQPALATLAAPTPGEITNQRLRSVVSCGRFLKVMLFCQLLVLVIWIALNLPSVWFACAVELVATVYSFSPFWFYREPEGVRTSVSNVLGTQPGD